MYLFELSSEENLYAQILIASNELENLRKQGKLQNNWTKEQLLTFFSKFDVPPYVLNKHIFNMIQKDPLKKTIKNIQGDEVVFVGNAEKEAPDAPPPEQSKDVVDKMAKKALKK